MAIGQGSQGPKQGKHLERPGHWSRLWGFQDIIYTNVHIPTDGRAPIIWVVLAGMECVVWPRSSLRRTPGSLDCFRNPGLQQTVSPHGVPATHFRDVSEWFSGGHLHPFSGYASG